MARQSPGTGANKSVCAENNHIQVSFVVQQRHVSHGRSQFTKGNESGSTLMVFKAMITIRVLFHVYEIPLRSPAPQGKKENLGRAKTLEPRGRR